MLTVGNLVDRSGDGLFPRHPKPQNPLSNIDAGVFITYVSATFQTPPFDEVMSATVSE